MLISKQNPLNTDYLLYDFEKQFHFELPNRYKLFLIKYNGGDTPETKFKSGKVSSDVRFFYGLGDVEYDLMKIIDLNNFISNNILPIARDSFGNYIALCLDKENSGKVVFCDHEKGYKSTEIAKDLDEFFALCKSKKIKPVRTMEQREKDLIANGFGHMLSDGLRKAWQEEIDLYGNIHQETVRLD